MSDSDSSSSPSPSPGVLSPPFTIQRKRAYMACSNCRRRKIKCSNINDENGHEPCERCLKRRLECEYVAVTDPPPPRSPKTHGHGSSTKTNSTRPPCESPAFHTSGSMRLQSYPDPHLSYNVGHERRDSAFGGDGLGHGHHQFTPPRTNTSTRPLPTAQYPMEYPESAFLQPGMALIADNYAPSLRTAYNNNHIKLEQGVELGLSWEQGVAFTNRYAVLPIDSFPLLTVAQPVVHSAKAHVFGISSPYMQCCQGPT
ncbi:hypothetical protein FB45DRAFT_911092 [Roridomyces roridus]|uniref:Zn(2)-C6 fungal-type domain-containing protein n=1 Tax=Roridomyces roridus TaxID=1738132 RepID=A0AAD7FSC2_9AGAR|nr:hypothetical protein FB45DRAFT_911092 [Roridomyces roridus]